MSDKLDETKNQKFRRLAKFHSRIIFKRFKRMKNLASSGYESSVAERQYFIDLLEKDLAELKELYVGEPPPKEEEFGFDDMPDPAAEAAIPEPE